MPLTATEVRAALIYDCDTGKFARRGSGRVVGSRHSKGYVVISVFNLRIYAHRLAWLYVTGEWPAEQIDHINGDRSDNRFANIRLATQSENQSNMGAKKHNQIGLKGVTKVNRRYRAEIRKDKRRYHLGYFNTAEEASDAYARAAVKMHGEFANLGRGCD